MSRRPAEDAWVWRYALEPRGALNRRAGSQPHPGALVRIGAGVGCLHPWTALGDAPLDVQLASLTNGRPTRLVRRALDCIRLDGAAREAGVSLFDGLEIPPSHRTLVRGVDEEIGATGILKLKAGADPKGDRAFLARCLESRPDARLRIDFNEGESRTSLEGWWDELPPHVRSAVDFLEDPVAWDPEAWRSLRDRLGAALALDREIEAGTSHAGPAFQVAVVKPALHDPRAVFDELAAPCRLIVTSYMDHPVGQCFAAYEAARWEAGRPPVERPECHGLLTHRLFHPDPFIETLEIDAGDRLVPPPGTGLGFDEILDTLPWTKLR